MSVIAYLIGGILAVVGMFLIQLEYYKKNKMNYNQDDLTLTLILISFAFVFNWFALAFEIVYYLLCIKYRDKIIEIFNKYAKNSN